MKARPILFSGPMVCALLGGRKTQTRRIVRPSVKGCTVGVYTGGKGGTQPVNVQEDGDPWTDIPCPYGQPGDLLWVRETLCVVGEGFDYDADGELASEITEANADLWARYGHEDGPDIHPARIPSIFMPRWASRLTLRVKVIRVERLNDIGQGDACAEGAPVPHEPIGWYSELWESINSKGSWAANPWVWVVEFEVIGANVDQVLKEAA